MKKFIIPALMIFALLSYSNSVLAAQKSRAALQTDLDNNKLDTYAPELLNADLTTLNDSAFNLTTDAITDISGITATAPEINLAADISVHSEVVTGANVLTTAECGKTVGLGTTGHAETLPAPTLGCKFNFVVLTAAQLFTIITTGAETIKGLAFESETDTGDDGPVTAGADTISFVSGTAVVGDQGNLWSDGTNWFAIMFSSNDGAITFTSAI